MRVFGLVMSGLLFVASSTSFAGAGVGQLKCQSDSGRTEIEAEILDYGDPSMTWKIDEQERSLSEANGGSAFVISDFEQGIFSLNGLQENNVHFVLNAKSETLKYEEGPYGNNLTASFRAVIGGESMDPRQEGDVRLWMELSRIVVNCEYEYSL